MTPRKRRVRNRDKEGCDDLGKRPKVSVRGKYAEAYRAGTNLVPLAPDVKKAFPDEKAVNEALRLVIKLRSIGSRSR